MLKYFIPLLALISACSNSNKADFEVKAELQLIDTLHNRLLSVKSWLDYMSLEEMQERADIIDHNISFCVDRLKEKNMQLDVETAQLLDEYKNYGKLYKRTADSFKPIVMETEELFIQLKTLKESAHSKDYKKETFLTYFRKEQEAVQKLYDFAELTLGATKATDLAYERAQKKVEEFAASLKD